MDNDILSIYFLNHPQLTYSGRAVNALSFLSTCTYKYIVNLKLTEMDLHATDILLDYM